MNPSNSCSIIGIDLGLYKSVLCLFDPSTGELSFRTIRTHRDELKDLFEQHPDATFVIEACALTGWVFDLATSQGVLCKVANTAGEAWKYTKIKRKTDRDDALRLVELERLGQLPTVRVPPKAERDWKALIAHRQALVTRRVALQNRLRALLIAQGLSAPLGAKAWTEDGLSRFESESKSIHECENEELWRGILHLELIEYRQVVDLIVQTEKKLNVLGKTHPSVQLLPSIPGVGPRTAETVVAHLSDPKRFHKGKEIGAYFGLVPRQFQSGETDRRGRITRRGPALVRKLLVECAWCMLRYNAWAREVYLRLSNNGKSRKKQAIVGLARKLAIRCWAMLRDGTTWRETKPLLVET
jgi:transposase